MTASIQQELDHITEQRSRATQLDALFQGYKLCVRSEGKSEYTIRIAETALGKFSRFLTTNGYPQDVTEITTPELREFILYLQQVSAYGHHPFTVRQKKGLSGFAVNTYLRSIRALWSWLV